MKTFDLVVFDWDGTLMDSAAAIVHAISAASLDLGLAPPGEARARHVIGLGLNEALRYIAPELPPEHYPEMAKRYRQRYFACQHELTLFAGVEEMLAQLAERGFQLAVATGKSRRGLDEALDHFNLRACFQATRCADQCLSKPHPQMLLELMRERGVAPERALMIGDTTHDLEMAKNANVAAIAVCYGAHPPSVLRAAAPLACVDSVAELHSWLETNAQSVKSTAS
ncbi:MAG: HAD-IA family hydrolase [Zoogloeaceae bacterium]|jgi:phosphoglycolate phosphatase|nr:HAD-IA family hydrolase [Zoogloeaceae bacterium]